MEEKNEQELENYDDAAHGDKKPNLFYHAG